MEAQSGDRGDLGAGRAQGLYYALQLHGSRKLVATFASSGREKIREMALRSGQNPFQSFLAKAECKLLFIHRQTCVFS